MTGQRGLTLVELVVATAVTLVVIGSALTVIAHAQRIFRAAPEKTDVHQRVRVGVDALVKDLVMAGAGTYMGRATGSLLFTLAPVMPYRAFGDSPDPAAGVRHRPDAFSFLYVPSTSSQTWLQTALPAGALDVELASAPNCPPSTARQVCGLEAHDRVLLFDDAGRADVFRVDDVVAGWLRLAHRGTPVAAGYAAGSQVAEIRLGTYYLKGDSAPGTSQLMRHDGWGTDLPVVDEVVSLAFRYFGDPEPPRLAGAAVGTAPGPWTTYGPAPPPLGVARSGWPPGENCVFQVVDGVQVPRLPVLSVGGAGQVELRAARLTDGPWCPDAASPLRFDADLLRIRRVHLTLRVQSALASLRGPAGALFARGGTARSWDGWVPDLQVELDVTPRNMGLGR